MDKLTKEESKELIEVLKLRFEKNMNRHPNITWEQVFKKLSDKTDKISSLKEM